MAVVKELIRTEENGGISFGNYELPTKSKASDFPYQGDVYKVKTFKEITKLERNGMFVYESVPGTAVYSLKQDGTGMEFEVEGAAPHLKCLTLPVPAAFLLMVKMQGKCRQILAASFLSV